MYSVVCLTISGILGGDEMNTLSRVVITLEPTYYENGLTRLHVKVERSGEKDVYIKRVIHHDDFECQWDYVWRASKQLLDSELKAIGLLE